MVTSKLILKFFSNLEYNICIFFDYSINIEEIPKLLMLKRNARCVQPFIGMLLSYYIYDQLY